MRVRMAVRWGAGGLALFLLGPVIVLAGLVSAPPGGSVVYVDPVLGNDATGLRGDPGRPFRTIYRYQPPGDFGEPAQTNGALTVAQSGDVVQLAPGAYTNDQAIVIPAGVTLLGSGRDQTFIRSSAVTYFSGPAVQPSDNVTIAGLTIESLKLNDNFRNALGVNLLKISPDWGTRQAFTNVTVFNARLIGQSDAVYVDHTNTIAARFYDVELSSDWDGVLLSTRGNHRSALEFYHCVLDIQSRNTITHEYVAGLLVDEGLIRWHGGSITVRDGPQVTLGVWARTAGSRLELFGTRLVSQARRGLVLDVFNMGEARFLATEVATNKIAGAGPTWVQSWAADGAPRLEAAWGQPPTLTLRGGAAKSYQVQTSTNLTDWTPWLEFPGAAEKIQFSDPAPLAPRRYYRLMPIP